MARQLRLDVESDSRQAERSFERVGKSLSFVGQGVDRVGDKGAVLARKMANAQAQAARFDTALTRAGKAAAEAGQDVGRAESKVARFDQALDKAGDSSTFVDGLSKISDKAKGLVVSLAATGLAAGVALGAAVVKGAQESLARGKAIARVGAQLGASPEQMAELGKIAGRVYGDNFGESFADVAAALRETLRGGIVPEDADTAEIEAAAKKVVTLADLMETDFNAVVRGAGNLLRNELAPDASTAFDIIFAGMQQGADKSADLLDTLNEYSTQFRDLGLTGQQAIGLLVQGLGAGARDADTVADALKEFAIRAKDGSTTTAQAFKTIGLDAKKMAGTFAKGGPAAAKGLDLVLDRIRAIKDPVLRSQTAVALFGTKAEDLQQAFLALDPSEAASRLGDFAGAADKAIASIGQTPGAKLDAFKRKLETLTVGAGEKVITWAQRARDAVADIFKDSAVFDKIAAALGKAGREIANFAQRGFKDLLQTIRDNKEGLEKFGRFLSEFVIPVVGFLAKVAIGGLIVAFKQAIETAAMIGETFVRVKTSVIGAFTALTVAVLDKIGFLVHGAAAAFGWVPLLGPKLQAAAKEFDKFADSVRTKLDQLNGKTVHVKVVGDAGGAFIHGTRKAIPAFADGGTVPGPPGMPQLAIVHGGERVIPLARAGGGGGGGTRTLQPVQLVINGRVIAEALIEHALDTGRTPAQLFPDRR